MGQIEFYEAKLKYETDSWDLSVALEEGNDVIVVDARSNEAYNDEHIPGAINIPHGTMSEDSTRCLDKNKIIVTYCDGIGCNASTKGAVNLARLGFNVKELLGGLDWWIRDEHSTDGTKGSQRKQSSCGC